MAAYTSTQSGNFNDTATWGGGGWPNTNGDTYTVSAGHTVTVNGDFSGTDLGASTVNGILTWATNANTALQHNGTITVASGGELRMGNSGTPVGAAYTAELLFNPAANNTEMLQINNGGKLTTNGTATWNLQSEAWASCYSTLSAQALSGQADISVPVAFANALRASGDMLLIQGTSSYTQSEVVTVQSKSGGTITLTGNLTNTHASGAYVVPLNRNVIIKSLDSAKQGFVDDDTNSTSTPGVDVKLAEFENIGYLDCLTIATIDYCVFHGANSYCLYIKDGTNATVQNTVLADSSSYWMRPKNLACTNMIFGHCTGSYGIGYPTTLQIDNAIFFGFLYALYNSYAPAMMTGCDFRYGYAPMIYPQAPTQIRDSTMSGITYALLRYGRAGIDLRNCDMPATVMASTPRGTRVRSQDHGRVLGAAKTWINEIGTIERQNTVARSGYAAECTPDVGCTSDFPLEIEWDIPCTHGDVITATVYVRVNSTYGTSNDPSFILDPDSIYGCNDTNVVGISAADTWTQLSVTGTANLGGAGVKGVVNCVLRIPHYVAGGKVYVDDFEVSIA